jgi:hypothetical protein
MSDFIVKKIKKTIIVLFLIVYNLTAFAQEIQTPSQKKGFSKLTTYEELTAFVLQLDMDSELLHVDTIGTSVQGRNIYAMKYSSAEFRKDPSKIKVLIFAQQHGNEQSGKEGALLLAGELTKPENQYLFKRLDLVIVPLMNPDGSEENKRRNGNGADLNRNHLILTEPETMALHHLFDQYQFDVTLDVHEYFPFSDTWKEFGYRNNSDELMGTLTNNNVSGKIRELSNKNFLPFMKKYFNERHISNSIYTPGGPPESNYIRQSTFDINDGRQSFGIQNTFSFIQEGMNGTDSFVENLEHRAGCQETGMFGLLEFAYRNKKEIKKIVACERKKLTRFNSGEVVSIQSEHARNGEKLQLPVFSYFSNTDSIITVVDYRPVVRSIYNVEKPSGYLVPKNLKEIVEWINRQALIWEPFVITQGDKIIQYEILAIDSIDFEGDTIVNPAIVTYEIKDQISPEDYIYVPASQLKSNMIVIALEPKSMLGLVTYKDFSNLLKAGEKFPVLRLIKK